MHCHNVDSIPKIRVVVRKRPLNLSEINKNTFDIIDIRSSSELVVKELKQKLDLTKYIEEHSFKFDYIFNENTNNEEIYLEILRPMIQAAFMKAKILCFSYGQTGSGKTFTMMGIPSKEMSTPGLYLLAAYDIFNLLLLPQFKHLTVWVSFYEIYCGKLFDLLNSRKALTVREDAKQNICICGLTEKHVLNLQQLMNLIEYGIKVRKVGVTGANADSSRSHGIIQITLRNENACVHGKISFVDLAGSERAVDRVNTDKQIRIDGAEINKSLLALKECIRALDMDSKHTPFRGSKLTLVLRDSFVGNCKTLMIANISPSSVCSEHTLNTLRYADRVKELRGKGDIVIGNGNVNMNYKRVNKEKERRNNISNILGNMLTMPKIERNNSNNSINGNCNRRLSAVVPKGNEMMFTDNNNRCNDEWSNERVVTTRKSCFMNRPHFQRDITEEDNEVMSRTFCGDYGNNAVITDNNGECLLSGDLDSEFMNDNNEMGNNDIMMIEKENVTPNTNVNMSLQCNSNSNSNSNNIALENEYKSLVEQILSIESNYTNIHKNHIEAMYNALHNEMELLNNISMHNNLDQNVDNLLLLLSTKEEQIALMKQSLIQYKSMLLRENQLSKELTQIN